LSVNLSDRAFSDSIHEWDAAYDRRLAAALAQARSIDADVLVANDEEVVVASIVEYYSARPVQLYFDQLWVNRWERHVHSGEGEGPPTLLQLEFNVPCGGAAQAVRGPVHGGGTIDPRPPAGQPHWRLMFSISLAEEGWDAGQLETALRDFRAKWESELVAAVRQANAEIGEHRSQMTEQVGVEVGRRRNPLVAIQRATRNLSIPLSRTTAEVAVIPVSPRHLSLAAAESAVASGREPFSLADDIAEGLLRTIASFSRALERLPVTADKLLGEDEETLRDVLLFVLNANWAGQVTGETFIGLGKTDISLRWRDLDAFIAECKFWHGARHFSDAVEQLLGRYVVWRDTRVALILFVRDRKDVSRVLQSASEVLETHERLLSAAEWDADKTRRDFSLQSKTDEGRAIRLSLLPVVVPTSA